MISCTSCGDIPMRSFAKPLSGAAWPMTSPVKLPSIDRVSTPRGASATRSLPVLAQAASRSTLAPVTDLNTLFIPIFPLVMEYEVCQRSPNPEMLRRTSVAGAVPDVDGMPSAWQSNHFCLPDRDEEHVCRFLLGFEPRPVAH